MWYLQGNWHKTDMEDVGRELVECCFSVSLKIITLVNLSTTIISISFSPANKAGYLLGYMFKYIKLLIKIYFNKLKMFLK